MVVYVCKKCDKDFNRKSSYDNHLKRKNPCVKKVIKLDNFTKIPHKFLEKPHKSSEKNENVSEDINSISVGLKCKYCLKKFARKDNCVRHMKNYCKIKKMR